MNGRNRSPYTLSIVKVQLSVICPSQEENAVRLAWGRRSPELEEGLRAVVELPSGDTERGLVPCPARLWGITRAGFVLFCHWIPHHSQLMPGCSSAFLSPTRQPVFWGERVRPPPFLPPGAPHPANSALAIALHQGNTHSFSRFQLMSPFLRSAVWEFSH